MAARAEIRGEVLEVEGGLERLCGHSEGSHCGVVFPLDVQIALDVPWAGAGSWWHALVGGTWFRYGNIFKYL